jgi:haloalkane dehalogenase
MVKDLPHYFSALVIMNTGLPKGVEANELTNISSIQKLLPFCLWRSFVYLFATLLPVEFMFRRIMKYPDQIAKAYNAPFPSNEYKAGAAKWPLMVPLFRDDPVAHHMTQARAYLSTCKKPALIMFGDSDPITKGLEKDFMKMMPHAKHVTIKGASHFLQETHGPQLSEKIISFLNKDTI